MRATFIRANGSIVLPGKADAFRYPFRRLSSFSRLLILGFLFTSLPLNDISLASPDDLGFGALLQARQALRFQNEVKPFLQKHCERCHNEEERTFGIRLDDLDPSFGDRQLKLWAGIQKQIADEAMPPEEEPQPTAAERAQVTEWIAEGLRIARARPVPKNGGMRRLTVAQYRNTLRELLLLEEDLAEILPADAVSKDGFTNNQETLSLSPLLLEAYFEIAQKALDRSIVDVRAKPTIQHFRMDLGTGINANPCPDSLIIGANNVLLQNRDFVVSQPALSKPFPFDPFVMRTKYRFEEGYAGNDTVRGWREYDSIYHAVFACMRGSVGYPKGFPYNVVPQGLLLRPSITSDEVFEGDATYGPKSNFKISLRELPDEGRFRVTVKAAKYADAMLLDPGTEAQTERAAGSLVCAATKDTHSLLIKEPGIYQVDLYPSTLAEPGVAADASRLDQDLIGHWTLDGKLLSTPDKQELAGRLEGDAKFVETPFGQGLKLDGAGDAAVVPRHEAMNVGTGDFTVSAWIRPEQLRQAGIVCLGQYNWTHGWYLDMPGDKGILRIETAGPDNQSNGTMQTPPGVIEVNEWQHVAAVVRRGKDETRLYVNGYLVAKGSIGAANLDNPKVDLQIGRIQGAHQFAGQIDEVRLYHRVLEPGEIQALVEPGRQFARRPPTERPQDVTLFLGDRQFSAKWQQPAFLAARLDAGEITVRTEQTGSVALERAVFTLLREDQELARRFSAFEKRSPRLGVHLGLRRDCGSTLDQVGQAQVVVSETLSDFVFEGAIRNFPSPDVEKDNVNYLAGLREIGVRSEYTDGRDMPRLLVRSVAFEGPLYDAWPPASHRNIFMESDQQGESPAYARQVILAFAERAFRRPVTNEESVTLLRVFDQSFQAGGNWMQSVKDTLQVVLTSPQFLFLIEKSASPNPEPLDDHELASKLSYFLWNGPPDQTTLKLAADGSLRERLDDEVSRMIMDSRFSQFTDEFVSQWLALEKFQVLEPDRGQFPRLARDTRVQLRQEPIQFVQYLIRQNLPLRNLIDSEVMLANEVVASYYGLGNQTESGFQFVPIPRGKEELGGVLSQAAILAGLSDGRESNPIKRGAWLARRLIAEPPDDPPPNVPALPKETAQLTLRERLEQHRNQRGCLQCHSRIDPWGIPLEEFDAGGRLKQALVDAQSTLPDMATVSGFKDLKKHLAEDRLDQVAFSVLKHLATYACGRTLTPNELDFLKKDGLKLKESGYRFQDMVRYVVYSPNFLEK